MGTAPGEELCLRWNDFESILSRSFCEMRDESDFFDVRIACFDDKSVMKTIPAHRVVLSACSPVFKELLRAIGTGDSKGPLIFLRGISYHEIEAVLEFMYNGQTKVQQTELDAFLAAAEELKIKGLTTSNPTGNTNDSTPTSRKRPSTHVQHEDSPFDNNGAGLQKSSKSKKSRPAPNAVGQAGPSSAHTSDGNAGNMAVKAEEVTLVDSENDESYQDYAEAEIDEPFDESAYQDHDQDGAGADFPTDSKDLIKEISTMDRSQRKEFLENLVFHNTITDRWSCRICHNSYTRKFTVVDHIEEKHLQLLSYPCDFCEAQFTSSNLKRQHQRINHRNPMQYGQSIVERID